MANIGLTRIDLHESNTLAYFVVQLVTIKFFNFDVSCHCYKTFKFVNECDVE
jgi:hypothetical protein